MFLQVSQLHVRYPGQIQSAVEGVSFGLRTGDIGVLIGPSGCGKTTLLRAVAGLENASDGQIQLGGHTVSMVAHVPGRETPHRHGVSGLRTVSAPRCGPQRGVWHPRLAHGPTRRARGRGAGVGGPERHTATATRTHCPAASSSVWPWRARLAPKPQLLLLDEPFSNLDVDLRERLAHEVRGILKSRAPQRCL
jgi:iron(III) transport system ATP-binding protein